MYVSKPKENAYVHAVCNIDIDPWRRDPNLFGHLNLGKIVWINISLSYFGRGYSILQWKLQPLSYFVILHMYQRMSY